MSEAKMPVLVRIVRAIRTIARNKWLFLGVFLLIFITSLFALASFDLLPERKTSAEADRQKESASVIVATELIPASHAPVSSPERIVIEDVGVDVSIENPTSFEVADLDNALLSGAVRYPTSARLGEEGNVVLFGHSSYLPIVHNQNFKAFNGIQDLSKGDDITVYGGGYVYTYEVEDVREMKASEGVIPLTKSGKTLTLATCNSFGTPQDRFVVTATLVKTTRVES